MQRIERYTGLCVLTTNHARGMDEAFRRRLTTHLEFTAPTETERATLWQRLLPDRMPREADLDFELMGNLYDMTGGHIRNAVRRAAVRAADEGEPLAMRHLLRGGDAEYRAMGRLAGFADDYLYDPETPPDVTPPHDDATLAAPRTATAMTSAQSREVSAEARLSVQTHVNVSDGGPAYLELAPPHRHAAGSLPPPLTRAAAAEATTSDSEPTRASSSAIRTLPVSNSNAPTLPAAIESALLAILNAPISGSIALAFDAKEASLKTEAAALPPPLRLGLAARLEAAATDDELSRRFGEMTEQRRRRVLAFLRGPAR